MAIAPTLIRFLNLTSTPFSQLPKIFAMLRGGCKLDPIWMIDHIALANRQWKKRCFIVSSSWQKTHFLQPCQLRFSRLSLVRITPRRRYQANTFDSSLAASSTSKCFYYYKPVIWVLLTPHTWILPRIYHSCWVPNEIYLSLEPIGMKLISVAIHSKRLIGNRLHYVWTSWMEGKFPSHPEG
jgi:hypothetical protein